VNCENCGCDPDADLRSLLREALEELRRLEWYDHYGLENDRCLVCKGWSLTSDEEKLGHKPDCRLAALLAKLDGVLK
jgi:hypothetical protein